MPRAARRLAGLAIPLIASLVLSMVGFNLAAAETHVVQPGETLYDIGLRHGVDPDAIAAANNVADATLLQIGQELFVPEVGEQPPSTPAASGQSYVAQSGDTLSEIANLFGLSSESLAAANDLDDPSYLRVGQKLVIPSRPEASVRSGRRASFVWPTFGPLTARFWERGALWSRGYHEGLDIAASAGSAVRAAEDGVVVEADYGWNGGYGTYAKIDHGNGLQTLYGHLSTLKAKEGQRVERGDVIGLVGSTGAATGPHLHFEVRVNQEKTDPLLYLP